MKKLLLIISVWIAPVCVFAQTYSIDWHQIAGGGGAGTGGAYEVSGTIGQHDAGGALNGGQYSLTGGFWSLVNVVQTPGAPLLSIDHIGGSTPLVPTTTKPAASAPSSPRCAGTKTVAPGLRSASVAGANVTIGTPSGIAIFFSLPPL